MRDYRFAEDGDGDVWELKPGGWECDTYPGMVPHTRERIERDYSPVKFYESDPRNMSVNDRRRAEGLPEFPDVEESPSHANCKATVEPLEGDVVSHPSLYISGPMTGLPEFNFPAFREAAQTLREQGFPVVNPAEHFGGRTDLPRHKYLAADIQALIENCDSIALLDEWWNSEGAKLEVQVGLDRGYKFYDWFDGKLYGLSRVTIESALGGDWWAAERQDVLDRFAAELGKATGDGSKKRQAGEKPPWYRDMSHEAAIFSHLTKWKRGELKDADSGAHPLVHAAWRCLAIACRESGNIPEGER